MNIKSEKSIINAPVVEVFNFLANAENIGELLPKGEVKEFQGDEQQCSFKVQAGVTISLVQKEIVKNEKIVMESGDQSPFPFELVIIMSEKGDQTKGYIDFEGEVNAFLKMMVKKPLTNLFNHMTQALKEKYD